MDTGARVARRSAVGIATMALVLGLAACSSPGGESASGGDAAAAQGEGLPDVVKIMNLRALTGPVSFAGTAAQKGIDLAVQQIEDDGLLEGTMLEIDTQDVASDTQQAASYASQAVSDTSYAAVLGPEASAQATALSPILQSAGMPVVYVQAGSEGVLTGDFTFRITPPASTYFPIIGPWLQEEAVATASVLFNTANPTLVQLAQDTIPSLAGSEGFEVLSTSGVEGTAADFTTQASAIAGERPDVVFLMLTGPQYPVAISQLRQAGYEGRFVGMTAMGSNNLEPAGETAAGAVWPAGFTADQPAASSAEFVTAYQAEYPGEVPTNYSAEAYDAVWFLARGLAEAQSADRAALQAGLATVAEGGFAGAQGDVTFEGNDARVPGVLVTWDGAAEVPLADAGQ